MSDALLRLRSATPARVALGRCGAGLPTRALLDFQFAHASARDAVLQPFAPDELLRELAALDARPVRSLATDRRCYLQRPDLGRRLRPEDARTLPAGPFDAVFVIADGLSAPAVQRHAVPVLQQLLPALTGWRLAPPIIACQARVALGDEIGAALSASLAVVLIGERPGLSSPDSLGAYLTWEPRRGRLDSERNCVSNIRPPTGLSYVDAAERLLWLMRAARRERLTGVQLKDRSAAELDVSRAAGWLP